MQQETVIVVRSAQPMLQKSKHYLVLWKQGEKFWEIERRANADGTSMFEVRPAKPPVVSTMRTAPMPTEAMEAVIDALEARKKAAAELEEQMRRKSLLSGIEDPAIVAFVPYGQKVKHRRGWCSL